MSVQAITWALEQQTGDPRAKIVLLCLANYADEDWQCWPSQSTLADQTEQSIDTVADRLADLEERGFIRKAEMRRADGGRTSNLYTLLPQSTPPYRHWRGAPPATSGGPLPPPAGGPTALQRGGPTATVREHEPLFEPSFKKKDDSSEFSEKQEEQNMLMTWIQDHEPLWPALAARYQKERGHPPLAIGSKYDTGTGHYFPHDWVIEAFNAAHGGGSPNGGLVAPSAVSGGMAHGRR